MTDLTVALKLFLDSRGIAPGVAGGKRGIKDFSTSATRDLSSVERTIGGIRKQVIGLGIGIGTLSKLRQSAALDKQLTQIGQTAGASRKEVSGLRDEVFRLGRETGRPIDSLVGGINNLIQSGQTYKQALATIAAINPASAVTGAGEDVLASGLTVASTTFGFDLSKVENATTLLDEMVVAGRAGNAELEDLAGIFGRVGVNAETANLQFPQTLGFIEGLSQVERNPERLATLADSTLRLFTNNKYKLAAQAATKVPFYNKDGSGREPLDVLDDISKRFKVLKTDRARDTFVAKAFGNTDLDTQRGLKTLLSGESLEQIRRFTKDIENASGTVARDLPEAINNSVDQAARLGTTLRLAGESLARPINKGLADLIDYQLKPAKDGGLGLSSGGVALTTGAGVLAAGALGYGARRLLGKVPLVGGLLGDAAGLASGVAQGKGLEKLAGVTPVFVVNFPGDSGAGKSPAALAGSVAAGAITGDVLKSTIARGIGVTALRATGLVGAAGAAGYGVGTIAYKGLFEGTAFSDAIGRAIARGLAAFGSQEARDALDAEARAKVGGTIKIEVTDGKSRVTSVNKTGNVDFDFSSGPAALAN